MGSQERACSENCPVTTCYTNARDEDIREEYVETDLELSLGVPRHLMDHEENKSSYPREETGGGMRHIGRYIESNGISEKKARERDTDII